MQLKYFFIKLGLCAFVATLFNISLPDQARAQLKVCNETGEKRDVAIGYKGDEDWTSEGWWTVDNGDCRIVIKDELSRIFYYYRAQHKGGDFDGESYIFCTQQEPFTIVGDKDCKSRGYKTADFRKLELIKGVTGFTLTLDDENIYSSKSLAENNTGKSAPSSSSAAESSPAPATQITTGPDAPVGTHGEPYSLWTIFDGCDYVDGLLWCYFKYEGWTYTVKDDGKSHEYLLNEIDALPIGSTVDISGDMISYANNGADITIRSYSQVAGSDSSSAVAPGTYGEPYSITAIFKGCSDDFGEQNCMFSADGWRYAIPNDGKTSQTLWNNMQGLIPNHRYGLAGDIVNYGDITVVATVRTLDPVATSNDELILNSLIGLWTSTQDPSYQMRVTEEHVRSDYSNGEINWEAQLSMTYQCDDLQVPQTGALLLQANGPDGPEDVLCYEILEQSVNTLALIYLPRGNILEFEIRDGDY